jgi:hypothetical protein
MTTMIGMPLMVDNTNCLSIFHLIFQLNTTAPHVYVYVHEGTHAPNFVKIGNGFPNSNKFFIPMIIY